MSSGSACTHQQLLQTGPDPIEEEEEEQEEAEMQDADSDDGDSSDPGEGDVSVIKIVSDDPWQAARAAAILKQVRSSQPFYDTVPLIRILIPRSTSTTSSPSPRAVAV